MKTTHETREALREMAGTVAVKGALLIELLDDIAILAAQNTALIKQMGASVETERQLRERIAGLEALLRAARAWVEEDADALEQCHQPYDPLNAADEEVRCEVEARRLWLRDTAQEPT